MALGFSIKIFFSGLGGGGGGNDYLRPVYLYDLDIFCMHVQRMKTQKQIPPNIIINISRCVLWFTCCLGALCVLGGGGGRPVETRPVLLML